MEQRSRKEDLVLMTIGVGFGCMIVSVLNMSWQFTDPVSILNATWPFWAGAALGIWKRK